jgi:hypothetical protein
VNLRCPAREMPRERPTAPSCECHEGNDAGAGATKRGLQRTRCAHLQLVSLLRCRDDSSGVVRAAVVCVLLRMNRGFQGCDVIASLLLLQSVLLQCPTYQRARPGGIPHGRRPTTRIRPSWPPGRGERLGCRSVLRALVVSLRKLPRFRTVVNPCEPLPPSQRCVYCRSDHPVLVVR